MPEREALLLLAVRAQIRSLQQEAEDLPPAAAALVRAAVKQLATRSRRLAREAAARLRSH